MTLGPLRGRSYTQNQAFPRSKNRVEEWAWPTFFSARSEPQMAMIDLEKDIERRVEELDPQIELVALEHPAPNALRLFIDYPGGVTLGLCEEVTGHLRELLVDNSLEVSS